MPKLFYIILGFILLLVIATFVLIAQHGPLVGGIIMGLIVAGLFFAAYLAAGRSFQRLLMAPFLVKGAVLRKARAQVHNVREARRQSVQEMHQKKVGEDDEGPSELPRNIRYFTIDVTIRPTSPARNISKWDPNELMLIPFFNKPIDPDSDEPLSGYVEHWELYKDGQFVEPGSDEKLLQDRQRIKVLFAIPSKFRRVRFCYFRQCFGDIELSEPLKENQAEANGSATQQDAPAAKADPDEASGRTVNVSDERAMRPMPRRNQQKNRVKNTQRLNLSLLAENSNGSPDADEPEQSDLSVPPWAAAKKKLSNGGPRTISVPDDEEDDDWDAESGSYRNQHVRVTNRINIPPAPRFADDSQPASRLEAPVPAGGRDDDQPPAQPQNRSGDSDRAGAPARPKSPSPAQGDEDEDGAIFGKSAVDEDLLEKAAGGGESPAPDDGGNRMKAVKPIKIEPQPISARSTAVKQSTLTQRLMALSQGTAGETGSPAPSADAQETQPWEKPKRPDELQESEPAQAQAAPPQKPQPAPTAAPVRKFFVSRDGQPTGPYNFSDVREMVENGEIQETDHAWTEGLPYWVTVASILYNYR